MSLTPYRAWLHCRCCGNGFEGDVDGAGHPENDACPLCGERLAVKRLNTDDARYVLTDKGLAAIGKGRA